MPAREALRRHLDAEGCAGMLSTRQIAWERARGRTWRYVVIFARSGGQFIPHAGCSSSRRTSYMFIHTSRPLMLDISSLSARATRPGNTLPAHFRLRISLTAPITDSHADTLIGSPSTVLSASLHSSTAFLALSYCCEDGVGEVRSEADKH